VTAFFVYTVFVMKKPLSLLKTILMYFLISLLISVLGLSDASQADQDQGVVVQQEKPGSFYHS
jgi:hypothetical protein